MAYLSANNGPVSGQMFELDAATSMIGRAPDCEIQIEDYAVSRQHAKIIAEDGAFYLEDLKSRNRTYLNDKGVEGGRQRLRDNDRVNVCDVVFVFVAFDLISFMKPNPCFQSCFFFADSQDFGVGVWIFTFCLFAG